MDPIKPIQAPVTMRVNNASGATEEEKNRQEKEGRRPRKKSEPANVDKRVLPSESVVPPAETSQGLLQIIDSSSVLKLLRLSEQSSERASKAASALKKTKNAFSPKTLDGSKVNKRL